MSLSGRLRAASGEVAEEADGTPAIREAYRRAMRPELGFFDAAMPQ
jgi:hypothetical protein